MLLSCFLTIHSESTPLPDPLPNPVIDTLGNWYNLGRVSGNKTYANALVPYIDDDFALIDLYHFSAGNNHIEAGMSTLSLLGTMYGSGIFLVMIPGIDIIAAPSPGNRLSASITSANFYFGIAGEAHIGFQDPFYFANNYSWDFLSRRGAIQVDPDQYETSFYLGPQLNAGQIRSHVDINHSINFGHTNNPGFFSVDSYIAGGIRDNVTCTGDFYYGYTDHVYSYFNRSAVISTSYYDASDTLVTSCNVETRLKPLIFTAGYAYERLRDYTGRDVFLSPSGELETGDRSFNENHLHKVYADFTLITGKHISFLSEVNGNWDGYFSPLLGPGQVMATLRPEGWYIKSYLTGNFQALTLDHALRYGLTRYLTIGERGNVLFSTIYEPRYDVAVTAALSNIPLRTRGPEHISKFEYVFGYWPRKGEVRIDGTIRVPLPRFNQVIYRTSPVVDYISNSTVNTMNDVDLTGSLSSSSVSGYNQPLINNYDHRLKISAGITSNLILSNEFDAKTVRTLHISNGGPYGDYLESMVPDTVNNTIFADQISFHIGNVELYLHSLSTAFFWQTDDQTSDRDRFDFLLSYVFTAGF